jgi:phosphatidylinositol glycan class B
LTAPRPSGGVGWSASSALGAIAMLAILLRLVPVLLVPSIDWADEIFQTTEQAHRLVYGTGLVPWEFQLGARSWLLPGAIAGLMEVARLFGDGPRFYLPVITLALAALAVVPVLCCFGLARRRFGLPGAIVAGFAVAIAPELVYFGARALSEVIAAHLLVGAAYLLDPRDCAISRRRLFSAGLLLGLALQLRLQVAPAIALIGLWAASGAWRKRLPGLLAGGAVAVTAGAVLDAATLGYPYASTYRYILYNVFFGVSDTFGVEAWNYYIKGEAGLLGVAFVPMLLLTFLGARQVPVWLAAAAAILVLHGAIAHKEYRFIYPAVLLCAVLAGLGLAQLGAWGSRALHQLGMRDGLAWLAGGMLAAGLWSALSFQVWAGPTLAGLRNQGNDKLVAALFAARLPEPCGIGLYFGGEQDWRFVGYTYLHQDVPIYWPDGPAELAASAPAFDILLSESPPPVDFRYRPLRCFGAVCVWRRPAGCTPVAGRPMPFPDPVAALRPVVAPLSRPAK